MHPDSLLRAPGPPRTVLSASRAGLTLFEVTICVVMLMVCTALFSRSVVSLTRARVGVREKAIATQAAADLLELMHNEPFDQVFALYNTDPADDPAGRGTAPGGRFAVAGLRPWPETPRDAVMEVVFPTRALGKGDRLELREDSDLPVLGMPMDLDGDNVVDELDKSQHYFHLPVQVRVRWAGPAGPCELRLTTILADVRS